VAQLKPGDPAPRGTRYVISFYPKEDTPGCTTEACQFNENFGTFDRTKVPVIRVSRNDAGSHQDFRTGYGLRFPLVSDPDQRPMTPTTTPTTPGVTAPAGGWES